MTFVHPHIERFCELQLMQTIGQGSFGTVHKALWRGVIVAAKVIQAIEGTCGFAKLIEEIRMTQYVSSSHNIYVSLCCILSNFVS